MDEVSKLLLGGGTGVSLSFLRILRMLRVLRVLRLMRSWSGLYHIVMTFGRAIAQIAARRPLWADWRATAAICAAPSALAVLVCARPRQAPSPPC